MTSTRQQLLENALERVAEQQGDITAAAMARFYAACPDAQASFEKHWPGRAERLEAEMVANALYFVMTWYERRSEIAITLGTSVPHHHFTLEVPVEWYGALLGAVIDELATGTPTDAAEERAMWRDLHAELTQAVASSL
jgi:hypothetical protein